MLLTAQPHVAAVSHPGRRNRPSFPPALQFAQQPCGAEAETAFLCCTSIRKQALGLSTALRLLL